MTVISSNLTMRLMSKALCNLPSMLCRTPNMNKHMKLYVQQGMSLLTKRAKSIILADKYGWKFVKEYQKDAIASDSDDEKHIKNCVNQVNSSRMQRRVRLSRKSDSQLSYSQMPINCRANSFSASRILYRPSKQLIVRALSCLWTPWSLLECLSFPKS